MSCFTKKKKNKASSNQYIAMLMKIQFLARLKMLMRMHIKHKMNLSEQNYKKNYGDGDIN
jgi:hypothetical protein